MRLTESEYAKILARLKGQPVAPVARALSGKRHEDDLAVQFDQAGLTYLREFKFLADRRFRFDFAFVPEMLGVEVDGIVHRIANRFAEDREKFNLATLAGWRVLRFSKAEVRSGAAFLMCITLLQQHKGCSALQPSA